MPLEESQLPIVDLEKAKTHPKEVAEVVVHGLEKIGFLFIDNAEGIDQDKLLRCCKWFFGQPLEYKKTIMRNFWNPENKNIYRGYFPVVEGEPSRKEGFDSARDVPPNDPEVSPKNWMYENTPWPEEDGSFPFKQTMRDAYEAFHKVAIRVLQLTAIGMGLREDTFDELFMNKPLTTHRIQHYPPWDGAPPKNAMIEDGKIVTTPVHTDSNFLTLLLTFGFKGLEVMMPDETWVEIKPRPNSIIMNIGDVFSRMLGGKVKATRHRVLDIGIDRYSMPFFFTPHYNADIGINFLSKVTGQGPDHVPERYGPWVVHLIKHVKKYFEYRVLPEIE